MSLFKERSANSRKIINLENTITSLKQQLSSVSNSDSLKKLKEENEILKNLIKDLKNQILQLEEENATLQNESPDPAKIAAKKRGKKRHSASDSGE